MDLIASRQQGTGEWFLTSKEFTSWIDGQTRTLLCPGIPGAGKTYLTAIVTEYLRSRQLKSDDIGIAVIFCSNSMREVQKKERLLGEILRQLLRQEHCSSGVMQIVINICKAQGRRPKFDELITITQHVLGSYSVAYVVIDALDECDSTELRAITAELQRLQAQLPAVRLMTTFRPQVVVEDGFLDIAELEIRATDKDLKCYIDSNITQLSKHITENLSFKDDIVQSIIKAADGM
jgi:hypothetical protein